MNNIEIFNYFPKEIKYELAKYINDENYNNLEEIRIRTERPIILRFVNKIDILNYIVKTNDILNIMQLLTENSLYAYQKQICDGFITLKGGHRVGIAGNVVTENNKVININYIYSLNFRISKEICGASNKIIEYIYEKGKIYNTLIISEPGAGKTTILRDLIKNLSKYKVIGIVDERGEIAAMYKNIPQNDIGIQVDILNNISKNLGMKMLIRSMAPEVICADEIGTKEDIEAIKYAVTSGVSGIFTAHGETINDIRNNPILRELIDTNLIQRVIILNKENRDKINCIRLNGNNEQQNLQIS